MPVLELCLNKLLDLGTAITIPQDRVNRPQHYPLGSTFLVPTLLTLLWPLQLFPAPYLDKWGLAQLNTVILLKTSSRNFSKVKFPLPHSIPRVKL